MKKNNSLWAFFFCLFFSLSSLVVFARSVDDIESFHHKVLASFADFKKQDKPLGRESLHELFKVAHRASLGFAQELCDQKCSSPGYLTQLNRDIASLKKVIKHKRKSKESVDAELRLSDSLYQLQKVLKRYRLQIEVVGYHATVKADWGDMFDFVDKGQDVLPALPLKGIDQAGVKGLKILVKRVQRVLDKIDEYEDRLHADWVDLKLANYVFKIELIRLRNAAIFHPLYRGTPIQTNYPR